MKVTGKLQAVTVVRIEGIVRNRWRKPTGVMLLLENGERHAITIGDYVTLHGEIELFPPDKVDSLQLDSTR